VDYFHVVLHDEWLGVSFLLVIDASTSPLPRFIEDDVEGDDDALLDRVIAAICLGPSFIPGKDHSPAPIDEFLQVRLHVLDVCNAAKGVEVVNGRDLTMPSFKRRLAIECARQCTVEIVDRRRHNLTLEVTGQ
jgi:hypothetical protein